MADWWWLPVTGDDRAMEMVFARFERAHSMSMAAIMKDMSAKQAWKVLQKSDFTTAAPQKGYSGVEGARKLLNDMIYESISKYDAEILQVRRLPFTAV